MLSPRFKDGFGTIAEVVFILWTKTSGFVKHRLIAVLGLVAIASVLSALGPVVLKLVVDRFTHEEQGASISPILLVELYVLSQWAAKIIGQMRGMIYARTERRILRTLSELLFAHLMRLPLRFHLDRKTGAVTQALNDGLQGYQTIVHHLAFTLLPVAIELGTVVLVLTRLEQPVFFALFCGALVCYGGAFAYAAVSFSKGARRASAAHVEANAEMTDGILNYEAVKYFTAEATLQERVCNALFRTEIEWFNVFRGDAINWLGVATVFGAFLGGTLIYSSHKVMAHQMSVGDFVLVNSYVLQVVRPMETLGYAMQGLSQGIAMIHDMLALLRELPEPKAENGLIGRHTEGKLKFDAVTLFYRRDRPVLKSISFATEAGKTLAIVGASGSGKSSIVRLLVRLLEPDAGRILLDGIPINDLSLVELRQAIAVVPQDTFLFNDTIGYNIGFGKAHSAREEIERAAKLAHLHDFIMNLPEQYKTQVGERGVKLSGGEKQRIAIARAVIKHPKIFVFDEATSSLDSKTERDILRNLREISRASTTLIIAHRLATVVHADEIIVLDGGVIVERGTHSSLLRSNGHYAALWEVQRQGAIGGEVMDAGVGARADLHSDGGMT
jgi:ABC-type transport system involved in Fe-S cluster assembly fused permease/ATPase subunit